MNCVYRGDVEYVVQPVDGSLFNVYSCAAFGGECTLKPSIMMIDGEQMRSCQGCLKFEAVVTETEKAFNNLPWGSGETVSGPGSTLDATRPFRLPMVNWLVYQFHEKQDAAIAAAKSVPGSLVDFDRFTVLDIPCGDYHWMSKLFEIREALDERGEVWGHGMGHHIGQMKYIGADVVRELVDQNRQKFPGTDFRHLDLITDDLPKADVVFTRDCLVHLPFREVGDALKNIVRSGATWLVTTHFPGRTNHDIPLGAWRPLDLTAKPFYLPEPERIINEGLAGDFSDKSLAVWSVEAIKEAVAKLNAVPKLTIGLATYRDWPGVWATLEAIEEFHADVFRDLELIVVDNDPDGEPNRHSEDSHSNKAKRHVEAMGGKYDHFTTVQGTAAAKGRIFELATAPNVLVIDCHVMLAAGSIKRLIEYFDANPESRDLLQGPCKNAGTHFAPQWGGMMFGTWANDSRGKGDDPFEITMQGCGLFACRKAAWPGFHPLLRGFGPEEGHIHARIRKAGGKCLCLPWLRWSHRFGNPGGSSPGASNEERLRGYLITWLDTGELCLSDIRKQFIEGRFVTTRQFDAVLAKTRDEFGDTQIRGLGDRIEQVLSVTGIGAAAKAILGDDCGCGARRELVNRIAG